MDNKFKKAKKKYQSIEIPSELKNAVDETIDIVNKERCKSMFKRRFSVVAASLLIASTTFIGGLNLNQAFAENVSGMPVIGNIAKLLIFTEQEIHSDIIDADIKIPKVDGLGNKELEKKINEEIYNRMKTRIKGAEKRAEEYKKAFIETGGKRKDFRPIKVKVDYDVKSANQDILSFNIFQYESLASSYAKTYYYNIDLNNNKIITLKDMLGKKYKEIINKSIKTQIQERKNDPQKSYFEGENGFKGIKDEQKFYINEYKKVVIVFDKYEIAPGYMGQPEFVID